MNMIVHDDGHTNVISYDALESIDKIAAHNSGFQKDKFDLILTNPPFGSTVNGAENRISAPLSWAIPITKKEKQSPEKTRVQKSCLLNAFVSF